MNAFSARLTAAGFAAALALGTALTASAAPLVPTPDALAVSWPKVIQVEGADASQAQAGSAPRTDRRGRQTYESERLQRASPAQERGYDRGSDRNRRSGGDRSFYRSGDNAFYNGHRGYRYHRHGYQEYNGFWFPLAAFAAGAVIAGAVAAPPVVAVAPNPHVDWCARTYRSYNPYDNTFQPFRGPRQYCVSPWS